MRYPLAIAILTASISTAWLAPAQAAAVFPQGPCGGILCGMSSSDTPPPGTPPKAPQNCGGILCDMGTRAFPTAGAPVAAAPEAAPPPAPECGFVDRMTNSCPPPPPPPVAQAMPAPEPVTKHKKHKHVAAKRTPAPAETAAAADKAN